MPKKQEEKHSEVPHQAVEGIDDEKVEYSITQPQMKAMMSTFKSKMRMQQEPVPELTKIITLLEQVKEHQDAVLGGVDGVGEYFFKDFMDGFATTLAKLLKTKITKQDFTDLMKKVPGLLAAILVANLDNAELLDNMRCIFDHKSRLYQHHCLEEENAILVENQKAFMPNEERAWREAIVKGSRLDAIKVDPEHKVRTWSRCTVKTKADDTIEVTFENDSYHCDKKINIYSPEIAPFESKTTEDHAWRASLVDGDLVDCYDSTGSWYASTVMAKEEKQFKGEMIQMVKIALRVMHPEGDKKDEQGNSFYGWDESFDEWMPLYTARLQKYQTHTGDGLENQTQESQNKAKSTTANATAADAVDDSLDHLVTKNNGQEIFAVHRKQGRSSLHIDFINAFGHYQGFEKILERIKMKSRDPNELSLLALYIECLAKCAPIYHRQFVDAYFEQLERAVKESLLQATEAQLRRTRKEVFDDMLEALYKSLLPRLRSRPAHAINIDRQYTALELGQLFLKQNFLEKRIDGLKLVSDVSAFCSRVIRCSSTSTNASISGSQQAKTSDTAAKSTDKLNNVRMLVAKVAEGDKVLTEVFSKDRTHAQLVQRSEHVVRVLMEQELLTVDNRQLIWDASEMNDDDIKTELLKALIGAASSMNQADREFFIGKVEQVQLPDMIDRHIQLVTEICTTIKKDKASGEFFEQVIGSGLQLLWKVAMESGSACELRIIDRAATGFAAIVEEQDMTTMLEFINKLVECLKSNTMGYLSVKILSRLLKNAFKRPTGHPEIECLADMVNYLESEHNLLQIAFNNFENYMTRVASELKAGRINLDDEPQKKVIVDFFVHRDQIAVRLEFFRFYAHSSNKVRLRASHLNTLWDELHIQSLIDDDKKLMYTWLREVCDEMSQARQGEQSTIASMEDLIKFYHDRMAVEGEDGDVYKWLSIQGFHCIQSFFVLINEIQKKLLRVTASYGIYSRSQEGGAAGKEAASASSVTKDSQAGAAASTVGTDAKSAAQEMSTASNKAVTVSQGAGTQTATTHTNIYGPQPKPKGGADSPPKEEDPDDLEIMALVAPNELDGYTLIWRIATECTSKLVIDSAAKLLVQMHHESAPVLQHLTSSFDDIFVNQAFLIIEKQKPAIKARSPEEAKEIEETIGKLPNHATTIQKLRAFPAQERRILRSIFLLRQLIRASEKNGTHNLKPHASLCKGVTFGNLQIQNNITQGDGYRSRFEISISSHATVWELKKRIGQEVVKRSIDGGKTFGYHPKEGETEPRMPTHPATIRLFQMATSSDLKDATNGTTLSELKFKANENIGAFKKSTFLVRKAPIVEDDVETGKPQLTFKANQVIEEILERYSTINEEGTKVMTKEQCIEFTRTATKETAAHSSEDDPKVAQFFADYDKEGNGYVTADSFKQFFVDACVNGKDMTVRENLRRLGYSQDLRKMVSDGEPENLLQVRASMHDMPRYKIAKNEKLFDSLMSLLDLQQDVSQRALELIRMLATNPILYDRVLSLKPQDEESKFSWSTIFDENNVNKVLYSLEIVEAILTREQDDSSTHQWIKRFLDLGGFQELQDQLQTALISLKSSQSNEKKKYVDQQLKLIKIFVMASRPTSKSVQVAVSEVEKPDQDEESTKFTTPKKQIKHHAAAVSQFDWGITEESLFGTGDAESGGDDADNKAAQETEVKKPESTAANEDPFEHLRQVLDIDGLGELIVKRIDMKRLQEQTIQVVSLFLSQEDIKADDRRIIESAMSLWSTLISEAGDGSKGEGQETVLDSKFLTLGLLSCKDTKVRECFRQCFDHMSTAIDGMQLMLLKTLHDELKGIEGHAKTTREFFGLCQDLVARVLGKRTPDTAADIDKVVIELYKLAIELLKSHKSTEKRQSIISDTTLQGLLGVIQTILAAAKEQNDLRKNLLDIFREKSLLEELFYSCLFYQKGKSELYHETDVEHVGPAACKCATQETRKTGFKVVHEYLGLLEPHEMVEFLEDSIIPLIKDVQRPKKWRHLPSSKSRVEQYVGITNLGCICYMISMLQQLFMVPQFRYQLFKAIEQSPEAIVEYKGDMIDDNLLRQLQILFGYLELSDRHAACPKALCFAFKDYDGAPTATGEQKDSHEFLNLLFERLERQLRPTSQRNLVKDIFAGSQCSQLICPSCHKVKNKLEPFYNLSLDIDKEIHSSAGIYDSLRKMVKGQIIEDYACDGCNQKVNITQRVLLADMPNVLIVHLKRIIFCFDTLQNDKVNTRFEFPNVLDLKDYSFKEMMKDGANLEEDLKTLQEVHDDAYVYRLVGVNVHLGTADHGHYYSIINIKRGAEEPLGDQDEAKWRKVEADPWRVFDDATVKQFAFASDLKNEAFGGEQESSNKTSDAMSDKELTAFLASGSQSYGKSAYMLIYERKSKKDLTEFPVNSSESDAGTIIPFRNVEKHIPDWISDLVNLDNKNFLEDSQLFNEHFFDLIKEALRLVGTNHVLSSHKYDHNYQVHFHKLKQISLDIGGKVMYDMLCYYDRNVQLATMSNSMGTILTFSDSHYFLSSGTASIVLAFVRKYLLEDSCQHFFKIMFQCTDQTSRNHAGKLTSKAIIRLFKLYADCAPSSRESVDTVKDVFQVLSAFMNMQMTVLHDDDCLRSWARLECFFDMLREIMTSCLTAAQCMLEWSDVIADLIDFMLGNKSPRAQQEKSDPTRKARTAMGGTVAPPFQPLYTLVAFLVRMTHTSTMDVQTRIRTHVDFPDLVSKHEILKPYLLSDEAWLMLTKTEFVDKVLFDGKYEQRKEFGEALAHLSYQNLSFSRKICKKILKGISYCTNDDVEKHLTVVSQLLTIKDQFQVQRLEYLLGFGFVMHGMAVEGSIRQYGTPLMKQEPNAQVYEISSGLDSRQHEDALLSVLWRFKGKRDGFTLACLRCLGELALADEVVAQYLRGLPAPDYQIASYLDWVQPYLKNQLQEAEKIVGTGTKEKQESILKVLSLFEAKNGKEQATEDETRIEQAQAPKESEKPHQTTEVSAQSADPKPYTILEALSESEVLQQNVDEAVKLVITRIACSFNQSQCSDREAVSLDTEPHKAKTEEQDPHVQQTKNALEEGQASSTEAAEQALAQTDQDGSTAAVVEASPALVCDDLLYRFTVTSTHASPLRLKIQFLPKCDEKDIDIIWPRGGIKDYVQPGATSHIMTLRRKNPFVKNADETSEIAKLQTVVEWKPHTDQDFKMERLSASGREPATGAQGRAGTGASSTGASKSKANQETQSQRRGGVLLNLVPTEAMAIEDPAMGYGVDETGQVYGPATSSMATQNENLASFEASGGADKACGICTYLNPASASFCEMCTSPF